GAGRSDKRTALQVLLVPGLLANEDRARLHRTFTENDLRRAIAKGAKATILRLAKKRFMGISRLGRFSRFGEASSDPCRARVGLGWRPRTHPRLAKPSRRRHGRDLTGFREIGPVFLRHLLQHGPLHQPRRVEDGSIVNLPR